MISLQKNFVTLTNLVKLDLSKNQLKELPENFGELVKLKHLDLYKNQLQHLPLSFSKLKALKWLDLKDNPLMPKIAQIAGLCLDSKQCQSCAKDIVLFYTKLEGQIQQEKDMREMHRQKSLMEKEAIAQKQKQQDKKNKKKQKQQITDQGGDKGKRDINGVSKKTEITSKHDGKPVHAKNVFLKLFLYAFILLLFSSLILFVTTSLDLPYTRNVESFVIHVWQSGVNNLPPEFQKFAIQTENYVNHIHNVTGQEVAKLIKNFFKN